MSFVLGLNRWKDSPATVLAQSCVATSHGHGKAHRRNPSSDGDVHSVAQDTKRLSNVGKTQEAASGRLLETVGEHPLRSTEGTKYADLIASNQSMRAIKYKAIRAKDARSDKRKEAGKAQAGNHAQCVVRSIGKPTAVEHGIHVEFDRTTGKYLGLPDVWTTFAPSHEPTNTKYVDPKLVPISHMTQVKTAKDKQRADFVQNELSALFGSPAKALTCVKDGGSTTNDSTGIALKSQTTILRERTGCHPHEEGQSLKYLDRSAEHTDDALMHSSTVTSASQQEIQALQQQQAASLRPVTEHSKKAKRLLQWSRQCQSGSGSNFPESRLSSRHGLA